MKLRTITEWSKLALPRELRELYRVYWDLRAKALEISPSMDPYICNIITPQIFKYLKGLKVPVQIHSGSMPAAPIHMWAKVKLAGGVYIVDGSYYQAYYSKPIGSIIPGELGRKLAAAGISNLRLLLGVVDSALMGEQQALLDDGSVDTDNYDQYQEQLAAVASTLTPQEIKLIQGRLLPLLLYITRDELEHEGGLHDPTDNNELEPEWEPQTGPVKYGRDWELSRKQPIDQDEF